MCPPPVPVISGAPPILPIDPNQAGFGQISPTISVVLPGQPGASNPGLNTGVQLARPPLPDEQQLRSCYQNTNGREAFYSCVVESAMPKEYQITKQCIASNQTDSGRALACSTGRNDVVKAYDKFKAVNDCTKKTGGQDNYQVAQCIGDSTLGSNERYYLSCITKNKGDYKTAAVCALAKDLTPEQQIAISCAISTGGQPHAFAVCTGGQLLTRELDKCWQHGIATSDGCFGPNNEYRKFLSNVDAQMKTTLGANSVAYQAYQLWQNNVLAPGPNGEVIKAVNNGLSDVKNGPGENNEIVKAGNALAGGVKSIGKVFGF